MLMILKSIVGLNRYWISFSCRKICPARVVNWCRENGLILNPDKCSTITFSRKPVVNYLNHVIDSLLLIKSLCSKNYLLFTENANSKLKSMSLLFELKWLAFRRKANHFNSKRISTSSARSIFFKITVFEQFKKI